MNDKASGDMVLEEGGEEDEGDDTVDEADTQKKMMSQKKMASQKTMTRMMRSNQTLHMSVGEGIQKRRSSKRISNSSSLVSSKKFCLLDTNLVKGVQVGRKKNK